MFTIGGLGVQTERIQCAAVMARPTGTSAGRSLMLFSAICWRNSSYARWDKTMFLASTGKTSVWWHGSHSESFAIYHPKLTTPPLLPPETDPPKGPLKQGSMWGVNLELHFCFLSGEIILKMI